MKTLGDPQLDESILPVYQWYRSPEGNEELTIWNYINMRADLDLAVAFSKLFWPDFVEIDGCVFLKQQFSLASYERWKAALKGNRKSLEITMNSVRMFDLFMNSDLVLESQNINQSIPHDSTLQEFLGQVLAKCWKYALQDLFPEKNFVVRYDPDPTYVGPIVVFYQG
jgi:hypothetical protein